MSGPDDGLIDAWLDGELDDAGAERLRAWLGGDRGRMRELLLRGHERRELAAAIRERVARGQHGFADGPLDRRAARGRPRWTRAPFIAGAAATLAALVLLAPLLRERGPSPAPATARLLPGSAEVVVDGQPVAPPKSLAAGARLDVRTGGCRIGYPDGSTLELIPGSRGAVGSTAAAFELDAGALSAVVAAQPAGRAFVIRTPHGEARVLGTRFQLAVADDRTRLEVEAGAVELRRSDGASAVVAAGRMAEVGPATMPVATASVVPDLGPAAAWAQGQHGDPPSELRVDPAASREGRATLRLAYPPAAHAGSGWCIIHRPFTVDGAGSVRIWIRVDEAWPGAQVNVQAIEEDRAAWFLDHVSLDGLPKGVWVPLTFGLRRPVKRNSGSGDDRYDPDLVRALTFSIFGHAVVHVDAPEPLRE